MHDKRTTNRPDLIEATPMSHEEWQARAAMAKLELRYYENLLNAGFDPSPIPGEQLIEVPVMWEDGS